MFSARMFECIDRGKVFKVPYGEPKPEMCPECGSFQIKRSLHGVLFDRNVMVEYMPK